MCKLSVIFTGCPSPVLIKSQTFPGIYRRGNQWHQSKFILRGQNLPLIGTGRSFGPRPESRVGFLEGDSESLPTSYGVWGALWGPGRSPKKFEIWCNLKTSKFTTEMPYNVQVTTERLKY